MTIGKMCESCKESKRRYVRGPGRFTNAAYSAKRRGLKFTIPRSKYLKMLAQDCFYCFGPVGEVGIGLDRLDNDKGYITSNVITCCGECNRLKSDKYSVEETIAMVRAIKRVRNAS